MGMKKKVNKALPRQIFVCPVCRYKSQYRWCLVRHLQLHYKSSNGEPKKITKKDAEMIADNCLYVLNPRFVHIDGITGEAIGNDDVYDYDEE